MKTIQSIKLLVNDPELNKEGFRKGDVFRAEIDKDGKAWFNSLRGHSRCVVYPGDYELLQARKPAMA